MEVKIGQLWKYSLEILSRLSKNTILLSLNRVFYYLYKRSRIKENKRE